MVFLRHSDSKILGSESFILLSKTKTNFHTKLSWYEWKWEESRAYSRKTKHPGIRHFIKSALFEKKNIFLNMNQTYQKWLPIRGNSTSTCPSRLSKCPSWWTIWSNSFFYINNFIILHSFCLKYSFCIFCIPDLWLMRHNDVYAIKIRTLIVKTKNYIEMLKMY